MPARAACAGVTWGAGRGADVRARSRDRLPIPETGSEQGRVVVVVVVVVVECSQKRAILMLWHAYPMSYFQLFLLVFIFSCFRLRYNQSDQIFSYSYMIHHVAFSHFLFNEDPSSHAGSYKIRL